VKGNIDTAIATLNARKDGINYHLEYSPLGNEIYDPIIILCGITPGYDSWQMFLNAVRDGVPIETAARKSIYSNMREKMFRCLDEIGLFKYLSMVNEYWNSEINRKEAAWYDVFENESASTRCGIRLTQACNCAILRNRNSEQPSKRALDEIAQTEPKCLFNRMRVRPSTKLIIFWGLSRKLDTYWSNSCFHVKYPRTLLLPHPSGSNRVFNNYDLFKPYNENDSTQLKNAKASIQNGKRIIDELIQELN